MAINLSDLVQTGQDIKPPRITLFGVPAIGKTTFAAGAPSPIFIQAEDGLGTHKYDRLPQPQTFDEVLDQVSAIYDQGSKYETAVLDTLDSIEKLIFNAVAASKGKNSIEDIGFQAGYKMALPYWDTLLEGLNMLREQGKTVICLAHSTVKTHNDPETEPYDRYRMNLHDRGATKILGWSDIVLFANYKVYTMKDKESLSGKARASGTGQRFIYTQERPQHWGKNRYGLPYELPFPAKGAFQVFTNAMANSIGGDEPATINEEQEEQGVAA